MFQLLLFPMKYCVQFLCFLCLETFNQYLIKTHVVGSGINSKEKTTIKRSFSEEKTT